MSEELSEAKTNLLVEIFSILDFDNSGKISVDEFKRLGEAMYEVRTGKKSPSLSMDVVRRQLNLADNDGDLELDKDEWLSFSKKLAKMKEEVFVKTFTAYKSALMNRQELDIKSQNRRNRRKAKNAREDKPEGGSASVSKADVERMDKSSVDPSANRKQKENDATTNSNLSEAYADEGEQAVTRKVSTRKRRQKKSNEGAEETVDKQIIGKQKSRGKKSSSSGRSRRSK